VNLRKNKLEFCRSLAPMWGILKAQNLLASTATQKGSGLRKYGKLFCAAPEE
jgi:hypothetical protein